MAQFLLPILLLFLPFPTHAASLVNINTANVELLDTLPGIGPARAAAIIDYRTKHGSFTRIEELDAVPGIGPVTIENLKGLVTFETQTVPTKVQPSPPLPSSSNSRTEDRALNQKPQLAHEKEVVVAPAGVAQTAAAGAPVLEVTHESGGGVVTSPWFYGFLGLLFFSGAALALLS